MSVRLDFKPARLTLCSTHRIIAAPVCAIRSDLGYVLTALWYALNVAAQTGTTTAVEES